MARRSKTKAQEKADRPILTSRTAAFVVLALAVLGLVSARFGIGPEADVADAASSPTDDGNDTDRAAAGNTAGTGAGAGADGSTATDAAPSTPAPPVMGQAEELTNIDGWINSDANGLSSYSGQVRIVQFWTFGCYNCTNTLPHLTDIYNRWQPEGLEIIGVHAPEFDREADPDNVIRAVAELGVTWPVALDTSKANFRSWQGDRRFWPRTYVLDQNGYIRFDHIGEGAYDELEATVAHLIENGP